MLPFQFTRALTVLVVSLGAVRDAYCQSVVPAELPALHRRADSLLHERRFDAAREVFERLSRADSLNQAYWLGLGDSEAGLGRSDAATRALIRAMALGVIGQAERAYQVARLYARVGGRDSALIWLRRALDARYEHRPAIASDSAFARLTGDAEFRRLAQTSDPPSSRDEGWRGDLDLVVEEAKRLATGPGLVAASRGFDSAASSLRARIPNLSNERIFAELQRLVAMLGQGHSLLYPLSTPVVSLKMLPIDLYLFTDGLYVVGGVGEGKALVGAKVERIGRADPETALRMLAPFVTWENAMGLTWVGPYFLTYPVMLESAGIKSLGDTVHLELKDRAGNRRVVALTGGDFRPPTKLVAPSVERPPLYLRHPDDPYWLERLPSLAAVYVQFNQVVNREGLSLAQFADSVTRTVRRHGIRNVIVDVRRNNGGRGSLNRPLVRALIAFEQSGPGHRVYVIAGRNTFSAAQNFINDMERMTDATFAGEPSSSRPNFVGEDTELRLPYSGIVGSMSSRYFQDSDPLDERHWIAPGIPVRLSSADYFANRDPVLEAVLEAIRGAGPALWSPGRRRRAQRPRL